MTTGLGLGSKKMSPELTAQKIYMELKIPFLSYIGKVKFLRVLLRLIPVVVKRIMKKY
ncbi:hypothetical protein [Marinomonas primoryensis]|uniref:hypothetical protein n=1 Tax=Marinomonas primoryensis TaxID=178399 RepID=UPI0013AFCCF5|nr:hypothetical protein [Marinomonas primoryensis]